jgi:hypothetical protein
MAVSEAAIKRFLQAVIRETDAGNVANTTTIGRELFGEEAGERSTRNIFNGCRARGYLSRADLDLTWIEASETGRLFASM